MKYSLVVFLLIMGGKSVHSQDLELVRENAIFLSSPEMKGRGYVQGGLGHAAAFIASSYQEMGLMPIGERFFQPFTMPVNTFPSELEILVEDRLLEPGKDYLIDPASPSHHGLYRARVYDGNNLRDIPNPIIFKEQCSDCILVLDMTAVDDKTTKERARQMKDMFSGVAPVIWMSTEKLTWAVASEQRAFPVIDMNPGYIVDGAFITLDIEAELIPKFQADNVIGQVRGTQYPDSFMVFTAHYDHLGMMGENATFFGANDNASGVAVMLSLAKYYKAHPAPYTMVFMAFAGEEAGLLGSKYFVEHPSIDLKAIRLLVNLDLMGSGVDGIMVVNGKENPKVMEILKTENDLKKYLPKIGERSQSANSDHYYFAEAGVPAVFIYALGGSSAYHDIYDVYENLTFEEYPDIFRLLTHLSSTF